MRLQPPYRRRSACLATMILVAAAAAGTGCSDSEEDAGKDNDRAASAYREFVAAYGEKDTATACGLLTPAARSAFARRRSARSCADAVERTGGLSGENAYIAAGEEIGAGDVTVDGDRATVDTGVTGAGTPGDGRGGRGGAGGGGGGGGEGGDSGEPGKPGEPGRPGRSGTGAGEPGAPGAPGRGGGGGGGGGGGPGSGGGGGGGGGGEGGAAGAPGGDARTRPGIVRLREIGGEWKVDSAPFLTARGRG